MRFLCNCRGVGPVDGSVPKISEFYGVVIRMYYGEHDPPHFHADYAGDRASLDFPKP